MKKGERATTLKNGSIFTKGEKASEMFRPDERNSHEVALICLNCPLPDCNKVGCKRFNEEMKKIKEKGND